MGTAAGTALWLIGLGLLLLPRRSVAARQPRGPRRDDARALPVVLDLVAVALRAGAAPGPAVVAAASATAGPLRRSLVEVGGQLALGVDPEVAWSGAHDTPELATVAVLAARSGTSGARLAAACAAAADALREDDVGAGRAAAARLGVWSVLPLGLCFLPAFVCLGVVPAVVALLGGMDWSF